MHYNFGSNSNIYSNPFFKGRLWQTEMQESVSPKHFFFFQHFLSHAIRLGFWESPESEKNEKFVMKFIERRRFS